MQDDKIDIVYLWVDGSDKKWRETRNFWYDKINHQTVEYANNLNDSLYRDNGELKYSLRSVFECAPWVNHIYIVTGFNQVPKWLDTNNPKISIVPHEAIMPKEAIPTFNSNAIAMCIPNIPNLSEKFIIMNDDTFFNKPVSPSFFFDKRGRAIVLYNKHKDMQRDIEKWKSSVDRYTHTLILSALKIKDIFGKTYLKFRPSHGIDPYIKSSMIECKNHPLIKPDLDQQVFNKFRVRNALQMWLFELYAKMTNKAVFKKARGYKSGRHWLSNFIYNTIFMKSVHKSPVFCFDAKNQKQSIKHAPIFCINDSKYTTDETIKNNIDFLQKRFPQPSPFEKDYDGKIDIVYLWVDDRDEKWIHEKNKWLEKVTGQKSIYKSASDDERFRDNGEFLHSLRSVAECANWVNHIYIITGFNQKPKWLNTKNPRITIVPHETIMPKSALPTFNATAIEMCIPNIPGLSEKFIIMNDDTFFNKPVSPSFFFDKRGRAKVFFNSHRKHPNDVNQWLPQLDGYTKTLVNSAKIIEDVFGPKLYFGRPSHGIDPYLKSSWIECLNNPIIKKQVNKQIKNKFRTADEIQRWTFNLYALMTGRAKFTHARARKYGKNKITDFIYNTLHFNLVKKSNIVCTNVMRAKSAILKSPIFCLNDSWDNTPEILQANAQFLENRFPNKCEFEK
ncbi:MAG: Stealth CR1 domain-containing protein [Alphaproteobacteria bacterium]|nr:Stealth CR1 domain-containing protein [Alphaproteobacteria bacterium]